jgi:hypothetical protein
MDPLRPGDPDQIGGYRLVGRLGAGSMGQVFLGRSAAGRQVAVKLIRPEHAQVPRFRARFAREVQTALRVGGFHTAQVVAADPDADTPWMVTAYIPGPSLYDVITEHGPLPLDQVRALGAGLAEGLAAIHACDLVHRDLKPSNVIMAADGPRIIDFGIARPVEATTMTQTGAVVGTYAYMSPEQVHGAQVGTAGDVFSLGCVLAFAATGHSPFGADTIPAIVYRITNADPDLTGLPEQHELHGLIAACLAKSSADRPDLAEILAQLIGPDTVVDKPARQPAAADDAADAAAEQGHQPPRWLTADPSRDRPAGDRDRAEDVTGDQDRHPVESGPARTPVRRRIVLLAGLSAVAAIPVVEAMTASQHHRARFILTGKVESVAFSPDGKTLASGSADGSVGLWDMTRRRNIAILTGHLDSVNSVAFSPNGKTLASASTDKTVRLWDTTSHSNIATLTGHSDIVNSVAFSSNGKILASGSLDHTVRLWDTTSRHSIATLTGHDYNVDSVAFSPNGKTLAGGSWDNTVRLWDTTSRHSIGTLTGHTDVVRSVAFSPNGKTLASGSDDQTVRLWDTTSRHSIATLTGHTYIVEAVAFSPNGKTLASGSNDQTVRLWDTTSRHSIATLTGHTSVVQSVAFSPNGKTLASGSNDQTVRLWKIH